VQDLIVWLKDNLGKATGGTSGAGSSGQLASILFQSQTGTRFQVVPYRGAAPAMQDLVGGQIDLRFAAEGSQSLPYHRRLPPRFESTPFLRNDESCNRCSQLDRSPTMPCPQPGEVRART
jgi:hypothetical protein